MMPKSAPTMQARKQDFVRSAIWDAAMDLFAEKGFEQTTIDEIALAAGVSRRSFFRYFSSKNDLMGQGILTYSSALQDAIKACPRALPPLEVIHRTVLAVATAAARLPRTRKIVRLALESPAAREAQLSRWAELENAVASAFALRRKGAPAETPRLCAGLTLSLLDTCFRSWTSQEGEDIALTVDRLFTQLTRLVCPGAATADQA